ncbi:phosphatase PAP2 family protein [Candidatus Saccharibacteria bacterium]|nr:phosphatase PAP2 family protein [Candidatus Saccharibacteria bacterium]
MAKKGRKLTKLIGIAGALLCLAVYIHSPSFPTPDKLFIFLVLVFMGFGQAWALFKRLFPFVLVILVYESFRGLADQLNTHVDYLLAPHFDKALFGNLPTIYLQNQLWQGHTSWYDYALYIPYLLHFILPLGLVILVWKTREAQYWRIVSTYIVVAFAAFLTFFLIPTAPPWLASQGHYIPHIQRISSDVWFGLGLHNFPSIYNHITPNQVAAIPSLHAAWAILLLIFVYKLYGRRWAILAAIYPLLIFIGTVYEGEHYAFDVIAGAVYALVGYKATPYLMNFARRLSDKTMQGRLQGWINRL